MLTVLIAEQHYIDAIRQENGLFFEPFLGNRDIVFCEWKPRGQTLSESVPGLQEAVGRHREWRAIILHSCDAEQRQKQNPFDEVDFSAIRALSKPADCPSDSWEAWVEEWRAYYRDLSEIKKQVYTEALKNPLQMLSTWLCYRPAAFVLDDVAEKKTADDWAIEMLGEENRKPNVQLENMERDQYRFELRLKEQLRNAFIDGRSINIAYPSELYCICERITENGFFHPEPYWTTRLNSDYSEFADRNMLFDKMRFMVYDVLPEAHKNHRFDEIRFLYTVMTFASNPIPSSAMQSRRLYLLDSENDETSLCVIATSFEKKLTSTVDVIENEIEKIRSEIPRELTDKEAEALFLVPTDIPVSFDSAVNPDALYVSNKIGLASDCPVEESEEFASGCKESIKELNFMLKQQERALKKSVNKTEILWEAEETNASRLTSFQMDDVRDYTEKAEDEMIRTFPQGFSDASRWYEQMKERSSDVKRVMERRMSKKATIAAGAVCLGLFLVCLLPLLINHFGTGRTIATAVLLIGIILGSVAAVLLITLFCLRQPVVAAIRDYNNEMKGIHNGIKGSMQDFSRYLSAICNVRRGRAILTFAQNNTDAFTKSIRVRKKHQEDIRRRRAYLVEQYGDFIGDKQYCDETMIRPYEYDFDQKTEYSYPAPFLAGDFRQIEFLENGIYVTVPSSFVKRITLRMEEIHDR